MATPRSQRIGIWIIAIIMVIGTLGSFLVVILSQQNSAKDTADLQKAYKDYQAQVDKQTKELSDKYYKEFSQYSSYPAAFDASSVKSLETNDLKVGTGDELKSDTQYSAYYIGWNPKGVVFDQSIKNNALQNPISSGGLIQGFQKGVVGMRFSGVREISIPSDQAYGKTGGGENIPPDTPIKFIVMVIPQVKPVEMPKILQDYYQSQSQQG